MKTKINIKFIVFIIPEMNIDVPDINFISGSDLNYIQSEKRKNLHPSLNFGRIFPNFSGKFIFKAL